MRLLDLEPQFRRLDQRPESWTEAPPGEPDRVVHGLRSYHVAVHSIADAQGVEFLCPKCFADNNGPVGTHMVMLWSRSRGVPDDATPGPGRWTLHGTSYADLTVHGDPVGNPRSVQLNGGCGWHGFITNGEVTNA